MAARFKVLIQYVVIFALTIFLVWFSLRGLTQDEPGQGGNKWAYLQQAWAEAHKGWLIAMALVAVLSHVVRAQRWRMLMVPSGHHVKLSHSFLSLMVGYLVNLAVPRGGEVSRCYNLYKITKTPVETSFGTVVTERIIDVICLLLLIGLSFALESQKLFAFINTLPIGQSGENGVPVIVIVLGGLVVLGVIAYLIIRRNKKLNAFFVKTIAGFKEGLLSVFRLRDKRMFIVLSIVIWVLYFVMSYTVIRAFPTTADLGLNAVLSLFAIGAIAMAVPLPGGTGSYHVLVPQGLVFLYNIPKPDAIAFTFIFHGWQTLIMIVAGAISLLITSVLIKRQNGS